MSHLIYKGASQLTGELIQLLLSPTNKPSHNQKTGPVTQSYILRQDIKPSEAIKTKTTAAICGDCPLQDGRCYVNWGPNAIYGSKHTPFDRSTLTHLRLGAYGDPTAVPLHTWTDLVQDIRPRNRTGFTRQWDKFPEFASLCMASVFSVGERLKAKDLGFRTYRIGKEPNKGEIICPHTTHGVQCKTCGLCNGASNAPDIFIQPHGTAAKLKLWENQL